MSSPRVKSLIKNFRKCINCQVIYNINDEKFHKDNHCPPTYDENIWTYGHIYSGQLYSFIKEYEPTINDLTSCDLFVHISLSVIQLSKFIIGDYVVIIANNGRMVTRLIWPLEDNIISGIFITKKTMKELDCFEGPVIIRRLKQTPLPIKDIFIKLIHPPSMEQDLFTQLLSSASIELNERIVCIGQNVVVTFYGLDPVIEIVNIKPVELTDDIENLTNSTASLSVDDDNNQFFKIFSTTVWRPVDCVDKTRHTELYVMSKLGGVNDITRQLQDILENMKHQKTKSCKLRGVLLYGLSGTGKSQIMNTVAYNSGLPVVEINNWETYSKYYGEAESKLKAQFDKAVASSPSIILIDELDSFCGKSVGSEQERRVMNALLMLLDRLTNDGVLVLATTRDIDLIDAAFRRPGRFDCEIEVSVPTTEARIDILNRLIKDYNHVLTEDEVKLIASLARGFVGSDLFLVCSQAATKAAIECNGDKNSNASFLITYSHMKWALSVVKPSAMREILIEIPNVKWDDIGGEQELKLKLRQVLEWPLKYPEKFSRLGITPPKGILLFGPPGCSKTMIAKAVATESKLNFISIKGAELYSKWVGESEKAVREVFRRARNVAPSVVFFDEIDALAGERGSGDAKAGGVSVQERVLSQLLTELDGIQPLSGVTIVAATNRPDKIDNALLRPGRLDRKLYVQLPNSSTRKAILNLRFNKMPIAQDVKVDELTQLTEGYSGAEVVSICYEAAIKSLQENLDANVIKKEHFLYALNTIKPKTPRYLLEIYEQFINN